MASKAYFIAGVLTLGCWACDDLDDEMVGFNDEAAIQARYANWNGVELNGNQLNTFKLNTFKLNTGELYGEPGTTDHITLQAVTRNDSPVNLVSYGGSIFVGGSMLTQGINSKLDFEVEENGTKSAKTVWVKSASSLNGVPVYDLQLTLDGVTWSNLCSGMGDYATFLTDAWDPNTGDKIEPRPAAATTMACVNGALAKCIMWGYKPWTQNVYTTDKKGNQVKVGEVNYSPHHQACTRMVRADYCGTGIPHTVAGTPVHVLDQVGIQNKDPNTKYVVEAEWGPNGAVCLNPGNTRIPNQNIECSIPTCGASFASGGLIQSGKIIN